MQEETLSQILSIFIAKPFVTGEIIERIPITRTELGQRLFVQGRRDIARSKHQIPASGMELHSCLLFLTLPDIHRFYLSKLLKPKALSGTMNFHYIW